MITKPQFLKVYYPPKKIIKILQLFYIGVAKYIYMSILFLSMITLYFSHSGYYNEWNILAKTSFWLFFSLIPLAIISFIAVQINNSRIKKICKKLNIEIRQFKYYEDMYVKNK